MSESDTTGTVAGFGGFTHFGGLDWARYQHQLVVVDPTGRIVLSLAFANDAEGWRSSARRSRASHAWRSRSRPTAGRRSSGCWRRPCRLPDEPQGRHPLP